jgi:hypothetical protein
MMKKGTCCLRVGIVFSAVHTPFKRLALKKQQSRLTLHKAKNVVEGKMYILHDFSLKTTLTSKVFGCPPQ